MRSMNLAMWQNLGGDSYASHDRLLSKHSSSHIWRGLVAAFGILRSGLRSKAYNGKTTFFLERC